MKPNGPKDFNPSAGDFVTLALWTDALVFEVIKRTQKKLTLRRVKATRTNAHEDSFNRGGFVGHTTSGPNGQQWEYETNPDGDVIDAYWAPSYGCWQHMSARIYEGAHEYYDYNF